MDTPNTETPKKKSFWRSILDAVQSPYEFLSHWSSKSPLLTILAVVLVIQPVISTSIDLIKEVASVKRDLDPSKRPVTKGELDIINEKIDFVQQLVVADINSRGGQVPEHTIHTPPAIIGPVAADASGTTVITQKLDDLNKNLVGMQQKLDSDFTKQAKK